MVVFANDSTEESTASHTDLDDLPPSAKLVYKVLEYDAPLTQAELREQTRLSKRTTRHGLSLLKDVDLVEEAVYIPYARKRIYRPRVVE